MQNVTSFLIEKHVFMLCNMFLLQRSGGYTNEFCDRI